MSEDLFQTKPWFTNHDVINGMPRGMLGADEASMLYHVARDYFKGHGEIVDAGAFLGSSAYCFAKGLEANERIAKKAERIHSYDLFQVWNEPGSTDGEMADALRAYFGIEVGGYESTIGIFANNLGPLARLISIYRGDILRQQWGGRPIEVLFVDICKTKAIWQHVVREFYPSLIPGLSLVVHQDWHHPSLPYLHIGQEALSPYFEVVDIKASDSAVFRLVERIPDRVIERVAEFNFSDEQQLQLMEAAIQRFQGSARFIKLAKAFLLMEMGHSDQASEIVHRNVFAHGEQVTEAEQQYFQSFAGHLAERIERKGLVVPNGYDEETYLNARPHIRSMVETGVFKSGLHYWNRHGRWSADASY